ncbi:MAG TPA: mechanosensitive ion channel family protein [Polyangia bacterium]|jgi:small-conductance mechanosensitive channel/CRP-like cAMP-binding protein
MRIGQEWIWDWPLPVVAVALLAILGGLRFVLPPEHKGGVRAAVFFGGTYLVSLCLVSLFFPNRPGADRISPHLYTLRVLYHLLFCFTAILTAGLVIFDLLLGRRQIPRILRDLIQGFAYLIAGFIVLTRAEVDVTKIFTASVLTTAVIGLALQETLGNLMAGLALQMERDFDLGDWIKIDDRLTGRIREIRWRVTSLVTKNGDLVLVPNGAVARAVLTNFSRPTSAHRQWLYLRMHFRHPPAHVREVVLGGVRGVASIRTDPPADCLLWEFKDDSVTYAVRYWIDDFHRDDSLDAEVRAVVWYALHRAGMEIPFPSRNIHVTEMTEDRLQRKQDEDYARRVDALSRVDVFRALDAEKIDRLTRRLRMAPFGPGEVILREGDPGDSLYVLRSGEVAVRVNVRGQSREVTTLKAGQFFGEMSLMTGETRTATIVAKTDVECYIVSKDAFQEILEQKPELAATISEILSSRQEALGASAEASGPVMVAQSQQLLSKIAAFFGIKTR